MINKNLLLRGTLPFLNKKLLKHTFYDICDLEDENKERMKKAGITVTKNEVNEYFNNLLERYPMVKEAMTEEAISYMLISEGAKLNAIKYGETLNPEVREKTAMFIKDITSVLANKNAVILKRIIGFSKTTKEDK